MSANGVKSASEDIKKTEECALTAEPQHKGEIKRKSRVGANSHPFHIHKAVWSNIHIKIMITAALSSPEMCWEISIENITYITDLGGLLSGQLWLNIQKRKLLQHSFIYFQLKILAKYCCPFPPLSLPCYNIRPGINEELQYWLIASHLHNVHHGLTGLVLISRHDHSLPCSQTACLHHQSWKVGPGESKRWNKPG